MILLKMALASEEVSSPKWIGFQLLHSVLDEFALPVIQVSHPLFPDAFAWCLADSWDTIH